MNGNVRTMKWVTAGYEALLGIPLIGAGIVMGFLVILLFLLDLFFMLSRSF